MKTWFMSKQRFITKGKIYLQEPYLGSILFSGKDFQKQKLLQNFIFKRHLVSEISQAKMLMMFVLHLFSVENK